MLSNSHTKEESLLTDFSPIFNAEASILETRMDSLSPFSHSAMHQALNTTEVASLIRQELRGINLKSMVLVNRFWWKIFGPYLWENIYIDANPEQDDRTVIFRNGLAARCLTLSIYNASDHRGVVAYVTEKCCNIEHLHLRLFSPGLITCNDGVFETKLLDSLFKNLPNISELTISIAHEDLQPEVLLCIPKASPRLSKLTINGGLRVNNYILRKNWKCNWPLLIHIAERCQNLEELSVSWESRTMEQRQTGESTLSLLHWTLAIKNGLKVDSLKRLNISDCEVYDPLLDPVYRSCPNLRQISLKSIKITSQDLESNIQKLTQWVPSLRSFEFKEHVHGSKENFTSALLKGPLFKIGSLNLHIGSLHYGLGDFNKISENWDSIHSNITKLNLSGINNYRLLFKIMTRLSRLLHLTLAGYLLGGDADRYMVDGYYNDDKLSTHRLPEFACRDTLQVLDMTLLEFHSLKAHKLFFDRVQNMPRLERLEVDIWHIQAARLEETWSDLEDEDCKSTKGLCYPHRVFLPETIFQRRRQNFDAYGVAYVDPKSWRYGPESELKVNTRLDWLDEQFRQEQEEGLNTYMYDPLTTEQKARIEAADRAGHAIPETIFRQFPAVEYLYVRNESPVDNYRKMEHYISEHMASALVRSMPKLKVMEFDRALGLDLRRVKKAYPTVIFAPIVLKK